ncbi:hypothetical protein [Rheinheimera aquimaris]|uniref:hypothetical protein n=1 Tax=Rheinheimera aquimaris TaxID=412437 RepID=UPI003A97B041
MAIEEVSKYSWIFTICSSVLFIVIGWAVVYWNAKKLATRNETKSLLDKAISQLESLTVLATEYWLGGRKERLDDDHYQLLVMAQISRLGLTLNILNARGLGISFDLLAHLTTLTTLDCEKANTMEKSLCHTRGHELNNVSMELTNHFINAFQNKYAPN